MHDDDEPLTPSEPDEAPPLPEELAELVSEARKKVNVAAANLQQTKTAHEKAQRTGRKDNIRKVYKDAEKLHLQALEDLAAAEKKLQTVQLSAVDEAGAADARAKAAADAKAAEEPVDDTTTKAEAATDASGKAAADAKAAEEAVDDATTEAEAATDASGKAADEAVADAKAAAVAAADAKAKATAAEEAAADTGGKAVDAAVAAADAKAKPTAAEEAAADASGKAVDAAAAAADTKAKATAAEEAAADTGGKAVDAAATAADTKAKAMAAKEAAAEEGTADTRGKAVDAAPAAADAKAKATAAAAKEGSADAKDQVAADKAAVVNEKKGKKRKKSSGSNGEDAVERGLQAINDEDSDVEEGSARKKPQLENEALLRQLVDTANYQLQNPGVSKEEAQHLTATKGEAEIALAKLATDAQTTENKRPEEIWKELVKFNNTAPEKKYSISISNRRLLRKVAEILPACATMSRMTTKHILSDIDNFTHFDGWTSSKFAVDGVALVAFEKQKQKKGKKGGKSDGPDERPAGRLGFLDCGCDEDVALSDFMWFKTWKVKSTNPKFPVEEGMKNDVFSARHPWGTPEYEIRLRSIQVERIMAQLNALKELGLKKGSVMVEMPG
ncbi:hypothetical protein B0H14DRAFT_3459255 [Mycena olivaceomarginata]|nr:hypothetical protein B0H14DRAFT_3459255 [Mycena olivaceomarginata]